MQAGSLTRRIYADRPVDSRDEDYAPVRDFEIAFACWGSIVPSTGADIDAAGVLANGTRSTITIPWSPGAARVDTRWRFRCNRIVYDIQSALPIDGKRDALAFVCVSGVTEG